MLWRLTDCEWLPQVNKYVLSPSDLIDLLPSRCPFIRRYSDIIMQLLHLVQFLSHCELIDLEMTSGTHLFSLKYISDQIGTFHLLSSIGDPALKFCFRLSSLKHSNILVEEHVMV